MKRDPFDPQRHLVYAWEDTFRAFGERSLTQAQALRYLRRVCRKFRVPMPQVKFLARGVREWSYVQGGVLAINFEQCNHAILSHEMAHYIMDRYYTHNGVRHETHGPQFMSLYLGLLEFAQVAPRDALEASLKSMGIKWTR